MRPKKAPKPKPKTLNLQRYIWPSSNLRSLGTRNERRLPPIGSDTGLLRNGHSPMSILPVKRTLTDILKGPIWELLRTHLVTTCVGSLGNCSPLRCLANIMTKKWRMHNRVPVRGCSNPPNSSRTMPTLKASAHMYQVPPAFKSTTTLKQTRPFPHASSTLPRGNDRLPTHLRVTLPHCRSFHPWMSS